MPDAVMDKAVATALDSIIGCAGERCLAGSVIISIGDETARLVEQRIVELAKKIVVGDGMDPKTQMGPVISQAAKERISILIQSAADEGGRILLDGRQGVEKMSGFFLKPTVITNVVPTMRVAREEIFGPVVCLSKAKTLEEAIAWINSCDYANTTTIFTTNGGAARKFSYEVHPSMVGINIGVPAPMAFFSFGGSKDSFFGDIKVHGAAALNFYTDTKVSIQRWLSDASIW
jgi:malonate-semialdehyde dehydrogenase (acetylating)/methylmalonate-semialdehyde dehydrogenase